MDVGVGQPDGVGDSQRGTKKSSVVNISSRICSRKKTSAKGTEQKAAATTGVGTHPLAEEIRKWLEIHCRVFADVGPLFRLSVKCKIDG